MMTDNILPVVLPGDGNAVYIDVALPKTEDKAIADDDNFLTLRVIPQYCIHIYTYLMPFVIAFIHI